SSQPAAAGLVISGAVAAIVSSLRRPRGRRPDSFLVRPWRARHLGSPAGNRVAPDGASGKHGVDQSLVEIGRGAGLDLDRELTGIPDELADTPVRVVAGNEDEMERPEDRRVAAAQGIEAGLYVVPELDPERAAEWFNEVGPCLENEPHTVVGQDLGRRRHAVRFRDEATRDCREMRTGT